MHRFVRRDAARDQRFFYARGDRQQLGRLAVLSARAFDGIALTRERVGEDARQRAHGLRAGNRASRQASAALRPFSRAISMNAILSTEPPPSNATSMASASSSASSIFCASKARLIAFFVALISTGSTAAM